MELSSEGPLHLPGSARGTSVVVQAQRVSALDAQVDELGTGLERCFQRQQILADTMEALLDTVMCDRRGEPVSGLSLV